MYELLFQDGINYTLLFCLMGASGVVGLSAGGAPGIGSLAGPLIALGFVRLDKPQALAVPILILGQMKSTIQPQRSHIRWDVFRLALMPATVGMFFGIASWNWINSLPLETSLAWQEGIKSLCGLIVIAVSLDILLSRVFKLYATPRLNPLATFCFAFFGGILSTVANIAGPLFAWYFQSKGLEKDELTATVAFFFLVLNIFKLPFYGWLGLFDDPDILQSLADWLILAGLGLIAWIMWKIGAYWRSVASEKLFCIPIFLAGLFVGTLTLVQTWG